MTHFDHRHVCHRSMAFDASVEGIYSVNGKRRLTSEDIASNGMALPLYEAHARYYQFDHSFDMELVKQCYFRGESYLQPNLHAFYEEEFE